MTPRLLLETNVHPYQLHENLSTPKDLKTVTVSTLVGLKTGTMSKAKRITKSDIKKTVIQTSLRENKQKIASGRSLEPESVLGGNRCEQTVTVSLLILVLPFTVILSHSSRAKSIRVLGLHYIF